MNMILNIIFLSGQKKKRSLTSNQICSGLQIRRDRYPLFSDVLFKLKQGVLRFLLFFFRSISGWIKTRFFYPGRRESWGKGEILRFLSKAQSKIHQFSPKALFDLGFCIHFSPPDFLAGKKEGRSDVCYCTADWTP